VAGLGTLIYKILDRYRAEHGFTAMPIKVDHLHPIMLELSGLKTIAWEKVPVANKHVWGYVKFYYPVPAEVRIAEEPTTAVIRFDAELSFEWQRFVICKEMCHCLIDQENDRVSNVADLQRLLEELAARLQTEKTWAPMQSERSAEVMAIELLFPYELRRQHLEEFRAGKLTIGKIAKRYQIPTAIADIGLYQSYIESIAKERAPLFLK
jgi:IrrE N-terminal-like domain